MKTLCALALSLIAGSFLAMAEPTTISFDSPAALKEFVECDVQNGALTEGLVAAAGGGLELKSGAGPVSVLYRKPVEVKAGAKWTVRIDFKKGAGASGAQFATLGLAEAEGTVLGGGARKGAVFFIRPKMYGADTARFDYGNVASETQYGVGGSFPFAENEGNWYRFSVTFEVADPAKGKLAFTAKIAGLGADGQGPETPLGEYVGEVANADLVSGKPLYCGFRVDVAATTRVVNRFTLSVEK